MRGAALFLGLLGFGAVLALGGEVSQGLYRGMSALYGVLAPPLDALRRSLDLPGASAFLLGVLAAFAPCQVTTGAGALAYLARDGGRPFPGLMAFLLGKALAYTLLLGVVLWLLGGPPQDPGGLFRPIRLALGPLMVLVGLGLLGVLRLPWAWPLPSRMEVGKGLLGALALGGLFGLAFCPTLFWLFFGLLLPLALASPWGILYPAFFALGSGVPLALFLGLVGRMGRAGALRALKRAGGWSTRLAGWVLVGVGLLDTAVYWGL